MDWYVLRSYSLLAHAHARSAGKPIEIITGRGNHSRNGVGVLGPAVRNALTADGWVFDTHPGGVIIRGMRADRR